MTISCIASQDDLENAVEIWTRYINSRGDKHSEFILSLLGIPMVWLFVNDNLYKFGLTIFLFSMAVYLYFRNYYYKMDKEPKNFSLDLDEEIIEVEGKIYKIKKMVMEDKYIFVFYKKNISVVNSERLHEKEQEKILSIFKI